MTDIRAIRQLEPWTGADVIASALALMLVLSLLAWVVVRFGRR